GWLPRRGARAAFLSSRSNAPSRRIGSWRAARAARAAFPHTQERKMSKRKPLAMPPMDRPVMPGEQAVRALAKAAETYRNRTPQYGTSWKSAGGMLLELFNGRIPEITTEQQALRLFLVVHCVDK